MLPLNSMLLSTVIYDIHPTNYNIETVYFVQVLGCFQVVCVHTAEMNIHFCQIDRNENCAKFNFIALRSCEHFHCL